MLKKFGLAAAMITALCAQEPVTVALRDLERVKVTAPIYPVAAKNARISGTVIVSVTIDKRGKVTKAKAVEGPDALRDAAVNTVRGWEYKPYVSNGMPIEVQTQIEIKFLIN
jgi:protein TonB